MTEYYIVDGDALILLIKYKEKDVVGQEEQQKLMQLQSERRILKRLFSIDTLHIYTYITRVKEVGHAEEINHNS
jgi:hypothetical protein